MLVSSEQTIRDLQNELEQTRSSVIYMMPFEAQLILTSYDSCTTRVETYQWPNAVAFKLSDLATILPPSIFDTSDRAYCPLCRAGSSRPDEEGFRLPEGLRRHLVGWGDSYRCPVFTIARRIAKEDRDKRFHRVEDRAKAKILKRRKLETL